MMGFMGHMWGGFMRALCGLYAVLCRVSCGALCLSSARMVCTKVIQGLHKALLSRKAFCGPCARDEFTASSLRLSGPLKYFFSKDWSKNRYFLDFKGLISKTDSATRNFRPVSIFWCSLQKRKKIARLRRPTRVGNVPLPTPSQFLRHIWALPQT